MATQTLATLAGIGTELAVHGLTLRGLIGGSMAAWTGYAYGSQIGNPQELQIDSLSKGFQVARTYTAAALTANLVANAMIHLFAAQLSLASMGALVGGGLLGIYKFPSADSGDSRAIVGQLSSIMCATVGIELVGAIFRTSLTKSAAIAATSLGVGFAGTAVALIVGSVMGYAVRTQASSN